MKVLVVEDHPITRLGIRSVLELERDVDSVSEAGTVEEAMTLLSGIEPELVILDLRLGGADLGIDLCREIKARNNPPRVLVYTAYDSPEAISRSLLAGADSYVHKGVEYSQLSRAVRQTIEGQKVWLLEERQEKTRSALSHSDVEQAHLTTREREVLALLLRRRTNEEISRELFISLQTTKNHVSSILRKLGLRSRRELF
jgi:two-component system response regulator DevR